MTLRTSHGYRAFFPLAVLCFALCACSGQSWTPGQALSSSGSNPYGRVAHVLHVIPFVSSGKPAGHIAGQAIYALFYNGGLAAPTPQDMTVWGAAVVNKHAGPMAQIAIADKTGAQQNTYVDPTQRLVEIVDPKQKVTLLVVYAPKNEVVTTVCVNNKRVGDFTEVGFKTTKHKRASGKCEPETLIVPAPPARPDAGTGSETSPSAQDVAGYLCKISTSVYPSAEDKYDKAGTYYHLKLSANAALYKSLAKDLAQQCGTKPPLALSAAQKQPTCPAAMSPDMQNCSYTSPPVPIVTSNGSCVTAGSVTTANFYQPSQTCTVTIPVTATGTVAYAVTNTNSYVVATTPSGTGSVTGPGNIQVALTAGAQGGTAYVNVIVNANGTTTTTPISVTNNWVSSGSTPQWRQFPAGTGSAGTVGVTAGPDGNMWFTEETANKIGRLTTGGVLTEYQVPTNTSGPYIIASQGSGSSGALWFTEESAGKIGKITTGGTITEYPLPSGYSFPVDIVAGPDGNMWFTECGGIAIGNISPSGQITEFPLSASQDQGPFGIALGPDNALWFTTYTSSHIGRITTQGQITIYNLPTGVQNPFDIAKGPDGAMYFTALYAPTGSASDGGGYVGRISTSGTITTGVEIPNSSAVGITTYQGAIWFTDGIDTTLKSFSPATKTLSTYTPPGSLAVGALLDPAVGPDGNLYITDNSGVVRFAP